MPESGHIYYQGQDIFRLKETYRDKLGYLPQNFGYYPDLRVTDYLRYIASLKGLKSKTIKGVIEDVIAKVGLEAQASKKMKELSGGNTQRVGIAQTLLNDPEILILDEPTAGLDPLERIRFRNMIADLSADKTVLLSSHIVSDIESVAKKILIMREGQLICQGTAKEICNQTPVKVWQMEASYKDVDRLVSENDRKIVSVKNEEDYSLLRIIGDEKPDEAAVSVETTLEDAFFFLFGNEDNMNGSE
jgi:ABC-2 type transport system ATP-binding protein